MTIHGTDTSNHDVARNGGRTLDYAAMRRAGIQFGWHKTSDGLNYYADPTAPAALPAMRAALGLWGGYHVLWGNRSIAGQLDWFGSILDRIAPGWRSDPRFVAVWDCEPFGYNVKPSIDQVNEAYDYWLRVTGRVSLGYCPPWVYGADLGRLKAPLISSNYGSNAKVAYWQAYPGDGSPRWQATPKRRADILQYGSNTIQGPHATCDADAYVGTLDQLISLVGGQTDMAVDELNRNAHNADWGVTAILGGRRPATFLDRDGTEFEVPNALHDKLDAILAALSGGVGAGMTAEQFEALAARLEAKVPTAAEVANQLITQLSKPAA